MEELDEVEVLWPEHYARHAHADDDDLKPLPASVQSPAISRPGWQRRAALSRPVDVPRRAVLVILRASSEDDLEVDRGGGGSKIVVPPHMLVAAARLSGDQETAAYMLRSGQGRKRARDLRRLRNSVLRMTGFIEA
jgi:hypothetical protein